MVSKPVATSVENTKLNAFNHTREVMALPYNSAKRWPPHKWAKPDRSNQLDLFPGLSTTAVAEVEPITADSPPAEANAGHDPAGHSHPLPLAQIPPADGGRADPPEHTGGNSTPGGDASGGSPFRVPDGAQDVVSGGMGNGNADVPATGRAEIVVEEAEQTPSRDFRIRPELRIGEGALHQKAVENLAAIRVLKQVELENREATEPEKEILARYVGWGGMPNAFHWHPPKDWQFVADALKHDLTDTEWESARASTPNAHFTSPMVIDAMWSGLHRMGVGKGAQVLEPAMGVGHFLGLQPQSMDGGHRTGVELDSITARIAQKLYPDSSIFAKGFEDTPLPDNYFDVVVGNVPFGDYAVHDPAMKPQLTRAIHDYFFAKSLEKARPGGIMALITSRYTMDKENDSVRKYIADKADLIGAIRLPNTAFKGNAGTEVTTDILFLRKRMPGAAPSGQAWQKLEEIQTPDGPAHINEYFAAHPEMMLGKMRLEGTMYRGAEPTLAGELSPELLAAAIARLPKEAYVPRDRQRAPPRQMLDAESFTGIKDGAYAEHNGKIVIRNGNQFDDINLSANTEARVRGMMHVRDAVREVFKTQLDDAADATIAEARRTLNHRYDAFVQHFGAISSKENVRAFAGDPDQPLLLSLEHYDAESKRGTKTAIFHKRTLEKHKPAEHVDTGSEALAISLNETGKVDWPTMTRLTGRNEKQLQRELDSLVYKNPTGVWETADHYLSGDVRAKLKAAQAAVALDRSYQRNVDALTAVQPADLLPGDISARLGSSWIPASDVKDFVVQLLDVPARAVTLCERKRLTRFWDSDL